MLVVKIELWPDGDEKDKKTIGTAKLINDGTGDAWLGNYKYIVTQRDKETDEWKQKGTGQLKNFPRINNDSWDLLYDCLEDVYTQFDEGGLEEVPEIECPESADGIQ